MRSDIPLGEDVYLDGGGDRQLAGNNDLCVEASQLPIRRRGIS